MSRVKDRESKRSQAIRIMFLVVLANLALFLLKFVPTLYFDAVSVRADAINSLSDFLYGIVLLIGVSYIYRSSDRRHQYGHSRFSPLLSLLISLSIFLTGIYVLRNAFMVLIHGYEPTFVYLFYIVLPLSILVKTIMYFVLNRIGKRKNMELLMSIGEDSKADVLASLAALVGVLGGSLGYVMLDVFFGIAISLYIIKISLVMGKKNLDFLTGASPSKELQNKIEETIEDEKVKVSDMKVHYVGPRLEVYVEIRLPGDMELDEVHDIEERLKNKVQSVPKVERVFFHIEPERN